MQAKEFRYAVTLEDGGRMLADGEGALEPGNAWRPDHLLVAALLRCSLQSLAYHAGRAGLESSGRGEGQATVTKRESDGRYAVVDIAAHLEVALEPDPAGDAAAELIAKAERDCFVGGIADRHSLLPVEGERAGAQPSGAIVRPCPLSCSQ